MTKSYHVRVHKEHLVFSAAHFITFGDNICERLHGHNYGLQVEVTGPLGEHGYVIDFLELRAELSAISARLDHRVLLPTQHATIHVARSETEVEVHFEERRWIFPVGDCILLPIPNTTAEHLAAWILDELVTSLPALGRPPITQLEVSVDENHGQWATCRVRCAPFNPQTIRFSEDF